MTKNKLKELMVRQQIKSDYKVSAEKIKKWDSRREALTPTRIATIVLTAKHAVDFLKGKKRDRVLDIGCGMGEIDVLVARNTNLNILGCDVSDSALDTARKNAEQAHLDKRIKFEVCNVYDLKYPDNSFDIILSFGYVAAATYPGAIKEVARILKPGGVLICDFINCLSAYKVFSIIMTIVKGKSIPYYISISKIRQKFAEERMIFVKQRLFATFPPFHRNFGLNYKIFLMFENTVGRIFRLFLGRIRIVVFQKIIYDQ